MKITEDRLSQTTLSALISEENCPSCLQSVPLRAVECPSCNVVIESFKRVALERRMKATIPGLTHLTSQECEELDYAWRKVEGLYIDTEMHHQFLHLCYQFKSLSYAVKKYSERLERSHLDETADIMRRRALVLVHESIPLHMSAASAPTAEQKDVMSEVQRGFLRFFNYIMATSLLCGVFILLMSGLTQNKLFFFGLGLFLCLSSLVTLLFLKRELV